MPSYDEDIPRLAEIARTVQDFRSEFRTRIDGFISRDVYLADKASTELQISKLASETTLRLNEMVRESKRLSDAIEDDRKNRKAIARIFISASAVLSLSLVVNVIQLLGER